MENITEEFESVKKIVEHVLSTDQRARNNDLYLCLRIWENMQNIKILVDFKEIPNMINPETIRRVRQSIQNTEEKFLPDDPNVLTRRRIREVAIRKYFKPESWVYQEWQKRKFKVKEAI